VDPREGERLGRDFRDAERALGLLYGEWEEAARAVDRLQTGAAGD
jgi:hypothetical protein